MLDFTGVTCSDEVIEAALQASRQANTRRNVGLQRRGQALTEEQRNRIARFAEYYPKVDFSRIGL